jgi:hypothetical protein
MLVALVCAPACSTSTAPTAGRVAVGTWGAEHLRLDLTDAGGTAEYDCAHGTIDEPLTTDRDGRFSAAGTHTFEHGGPIRIDDPPNRHPARYDGRVVGDTLQVTVTVTDTRQVIGTFTVTRGAAARIVKCL